MFVLRTAAMAPHPMRFGQQAAPPSKNTNQAAPLAQPLSVSAGDQLPLTPAPGDIKKNDLVHAWAIKPTLTQTHNPLTTKGIAPLDYFLMREEYPGYMAARYSILYQIREHRKTGLMPFACMVWDAGPGADIADEVTRGFYNTAAEVLEPNPEYFKFMKQWIKTRQMNKVHALQGDILTHQFKGRYDIIASIFGVNRLTPNQFSQMLDNVKRNGLMQDGLFLFSGQFVGDHTNRRRLARYYGNVLFHCIAHNNLQMAQWVLGDWFQQDTRKGNTLMSTETVEKRLSDAGFYFFRERVWPQYMLSASVPFPSDDAGVYVYKAWLKHTPSPTDPTATPTPYGQPKLLPKPSQLNLNPVVQPLTVRKPATPPVDKRATP